MLAIEIILNSNLTNFVLGILVGNFLKPFMTEATKDIYNYYFKGGRKHKKLLKNINLIKQFMENNRGTHTLDEIKQQLLPRYSEDEIHNILLKAQELDGGFYVTCGDGKPFWGYKKLK